MANPHNSPWLKTGYTYIRDNKLRAKFNEIKKYATNFMSVAEYNGILTINKDIYLAKNSTKFRLRSHLDWAWYTPQTLAQAIDKGVVDQYYEIMLKHINSDPNVWKNTDFEMELKTYYAARVGRADLI